MKNISLLVALSLVAVVSTVSASHEDSDCQLSTDDSATNVGDVLYVTAEAPPGSYVYAETNGLPGLQRGGTQVAGLWTDGAEGELCGHDPDTMLY